MADGTAKLCLKACIASTFEALGLLLQRVKRSTLKFVHPQLAKNQTVLVK
jgi:predicted RNA binding protein YcfA (HicA-like mRNA interferase family)